MNGILLAVIEQGGYPNFIPDYQALGLETHIVTSVRKASSQIKKLKPAIIVAEFNYTPEFRDRVSNIESLLAKIQSDSIDSKIIVFYEESYVSYLQAVKQRFTIDIEIPFPINKQTLLSSVEKCMSRI